VQNDSHMGIRAGIRMTEASQSVPRPNSPFELLPVAGMKISKQFPQIFLSSAQF
jgi:hypothetical protein